jgi:hypothetical protein
MQDLNITVTRLNDGLNFGHGSISSAGTDPAVMARVDEAIRSPRILQLVAVDATGRPIQGDGCGDGRGVSDADDAVTAIGGVLRESLPRPKVFGGAVMMATATLIGSGLADRQSLADTVEAAIRGVERAGMGFGAHTDDGDYSHEENCGCGAIDKAPAIIGATVTYRMQIINTIGKLGIPGTGLGTVLDNFEEVAGNKSSDMSRYSGKQSMHGIKAAGGVVKQLTADHREVCIVLNLAEGYTVDQGFVRDQTDGGAQVFAVDVWRLRALADRFGDDPASRQRAFMSMLTYTLATAGVLTAGDLPVYVIEAA